MEAEGSLEDLLRRGREGAGLDLGLEVVPVLGMMPVDYGVDGQEVVM